MSSRWQRVVPLALLLPLALAALGPIRNYDLFWHLATGRWIVEHRVLPETDPFAVASDRHEWVNGEWLFEVVLYPLQRVAGIEGLSWVRALMIALVFVLAFWFARRDADPHTALLLAGLAFAGAMQTIDLRPSGVAALFVVLAIAAAQRDRLVAYTLIAVLWINIHPSALLAPAIALVITRRPEMPLVSALALLVNPFGWKGVVAPLQLMTFVGSGTFVNAEWLPSNPRLFPLLYATVVIAAVALAIDKQRAWWRVALALLFAYLAIRHVRHQPLWFAAFPLLVAPSIRGVRRELAYAAAALCVAWVAVRGDHRLGVSPSRFPIEAVARLQSTGLGGNIYNPDQFGGFLIWSFYPERRALTDGRNELYRHFIPEYARARQDNRAWRALLKKHEIDLAVDEYRPPLEVTNAATGSTSRMPASLAYWPRRDWALIGYDDAAMVFARRAAFTRETIEKWELRGVVPDGPRR